MQRIIVYIDGYNLYYSRLRGTPFKWLDLVALFRDQVMRAQAPEAHVVAVKYFTAPALAKFATHGAAAVIAQNEYHRALKARHGDLLAIISGYHVVQNVHMLAHQEPPDKNQKVAVWRVEEKQTDVNIALTMYRDLAKQQADIAVLCSNDSDMVPVVRAIKEDFPAVQVGIIAPLPEPQENKIRRANAELQRVADWTRHHLRDQELQAAQLPDTVATRKKAARRPLHW